VTITPHNAGPSPLNAGRVMAIVLENIARYAAGKPLRNTVVFDA
jgi:phosphoglycerate dehydrogenase-like enzyme